MELRATRQVAGERCCPRHWVPADPDRWLGPTLTSVCGSGTGSGDAQPGISSSMALSSNPEQMAGPQHIRPQCRDILRSDKIHEDVGSAHMDGTVPLCSRMHLRCVTPVQGPPSVFTGTGWEAGAAVRPG
jgi:hypothetical protein